jgi:hypothetical protein
MSTTMPKITTSIRTALSDLGLKSIDIIHAGDHTFQLSDKIRAVALQRLLTDLQKIS